jgi:hypothetical protein
MIFEMACYRGTQIWLDGEKSATSWSCGQDNDKLTSSNLTIGPHRVESVEVFGPVGTDCDPSKGRFYVFDSALVPQEIELVTPNGVWRGPVTLVVAGKEEYQKVTLASGEEFEVDEITLYLRAILQPITPNPETNVTNSMTNAEAATHFASLPPEKTAAVIMIDVDAGASLTLLLDPPGTNLDEVEDGFLEDGDEKLATALK